MYLFEHQKQVNKRSFGRLFCPVSQRVQILFRILCLSCNVKTPKKNRNKRSSKHFLLICPLASPFLYCYRNIPLLNMNQIPEKNDILVSDRIQHKFIQSTQFSCSNRTNAGYIKSVTDGHIRGMITNVIREIYNQSKDNKSPEQVQSLLEKSTPFLSGLIQSYKIDGVEIVLWTQTPLSEMVRSCQ